MGAILLSSFRVVPVYAQNLFPSLQWNNRVLILVADQGSPSFVAQAQELMVDLDGIEERELLVLHLQSRSISRVDRLSPFPFETRIFDDNGDYWRILSGLGAGDYNGEAGVFVALIGLDGGVKEVWDGVVPVGDIFARVDAMPMRQNQINP